MLERCPNTLLSRYFSYCVGLGNLPISNETRSDDKASSPGGQFHIINLGHAMSDYTKLSAEALLKQSAQRNPSEDCRKAKK
jgi:hypothetical protein